MRRTGSSSPRASRSRPRSSCSPRLRRCPCARRCRRLAPALRGAAVPLAHDAGSGHAGPRPAPNLATTLSDATRPRRSRCRSRHRPAATRPRRGRRRSRGRRIWAPRASRTTTSSWPRSCLSIPRRSRRCRRPRARLSCAAGLARAGRVTGRLRACLSWRRRRPRTCRSRLRRPRACLSSAPPRACLSCPRRLLLRRLLLRRLLLRRLLLRRLLLRRRPLPRTRLRISRRTTSRKSTP